MERQARNTRTIYIIPWKDRQGRPAFLTVKQSFESKSNTELYRFPSIFLYIQRSFPPNDPIFYQRDNSRRKVIIFLRMRTHEDVEKVITLTSRKLVILLRMSIYI